MSLSEAEWMQNTPEPGGGPDVRMTARQAEDLYRMLAGARHDWPETATWNTVMKLFKGFQDHSHAEIVIACACVMSNPLVSSPTAILEPGRHWDNVRGYLAGSTQGRRYADAHSASVLEEARADARHRGHYNPGGHAAATAALAAAKAARATR